MCQLYELEEFRQRKLNVQWLAGKVGLARNTIDSY